MGDLINFAKEMKEEFSKFSENFSSNEFAEPCFVLSSAWWNFLMELANNEEADESQLNDRIFQIGHFNIDIVEQFPSNTIIFPEESHLNVNLKPNLVENSDFVIISKAIWEKLVSKFQKISGTAISRKVFKNDSGENFVEIYPQMIQVVFVYNTMLRNIDQGKIDKLTSFFVPYCRYELINGFLEGISQTFNKKKLNVVKDGQVTEEDSQKFFNYIITEDMMRLWKYDEDELESLFRFLKKKTNESRTFEYKIDIPGKFLNNLNTMEECRLGNLLIIEINESQPSKGWVFTHSDIPEEKKCEGCNRYKEIKVICGCQKVWYCSENCQERDSYYHMPRCEKATEQEMGKLESLELTEESNKGLTGLQNLGNTCYMNSGLQCLLNTPSFVDYFLKNRFLEEINEDNPLGSQGKIVKFYCFKLGISPCY